MDIVLVTDDTSEAANGTEFSSWSKVDTDLTGLDSEHVDLLELGIERHHLSLRDDVTVEVVGSGERSDDGSIELKTDVSMLRFPSRRLCKDLLLGSVTVAVVLELFLALGAEKCKTVYHNCSM